MRVAIVGSRTFNEPVEIAVALDQLRKAHKGDIIVVSGGAQGADSFGEALARARHLPVVIHLPEWEKYGKSAGYRRNELIVRDADLILAFFAPGPRSKGTQHTIDIATAAGKPVRIFHEGAWL